MGGEVWGGYGSEVRVVATNHTCMIILRYIVHACCLSQKSLATESSYTLERVHLVF